MEYGCNFTKAIQRRLHIWIGELRNGWMFGDCGDKRRLLSNAGADCHLVGCSTDTAQSYGSTDVVGTATRNFREVDFSQSRKTRYRGMN